MGCRARWSFHLTTNNRVASLHCQWLGVWRRKARLWFAAANELAKRLLGRVRQLREARGLTQEAFAERAGFAYKYYQALETGRKIDFRISTVQKLAKAFGLEPWELLHPDSAPRAVGEDPAKVEGYPGKRRRKG